MKLEIAQSLFDSALKSQYAWRNKADQLFQVGRRTLEDAAEARDKAEAIYKGGSKNLTPEEMKIFNDFYLYDVGFFLMGLAVENLLKAIWSGKHHAKIKGINNIRKDLDGLAEHDLSALAKNAGVDLTAEETELLTALKDLILWAGRYPTPLKATEYHKTLLNGLPAKRFMKGKSIFSIELPVPEELNDLFEKLLKEIEAIPEEQTY
ncbi:hypothetical protein P4E94_19565 [Pontiellaceae bacterium B12219]|nr:hypothetical protein [Pontiellaceae bacterium B12219]